MAHKTRPAPDPATLQTTPRMPWHRSIDKYEWCARDGKARVRSAKLPHWYQSTPDAPWVWRASGTHASGARNTIVNFDVYAPKDYTTDEASLRRIEG